MTDKIYISHTNDVKIDGLTRFTSHMNDNKCNVIKKIQYDESHHIYLTIKWGGFASVSLRFTAPTCPTRQYNRFIG